MNTDFYLSHPMDKDRYPIAPQKVVLYAGAYVYEGGGDQSQWVLPLFKPSILRSQLETALLDLNVNTQSRPPILSSEHIVSKTTESLIFGGSTSTAPDIKSQLTSWRPMVPDLSFTSRMPYR